MNWREYTLQAAKQSRFSASLWFRYLRKIIFEHSTHLTSDDLEYLLNSNALTDFQKVTLKYATEEDSPTHDYVVSLNRPAHLRNVQALLRKYQYE